MLNNARLPFRLKVLNDPATFTRCDAAVVYVRKADYQVAADVLMRVHSKVAISLKHGCPAFTKALALGLGFAEDPDRSESFGMHRCRLVAEGMVRAHEQGKLLAKERLRAVEERFAEDGFSLERPYLNPGSDDDYSLVRVVE